jgi:malonate transporter MadL subunit
MTIYGVALLAICTLVGVFLGDVLALVLHVKSNVGGVGIAMALLIAARVWLMKKDALSHGMKLGIEFWGSLYIPIVVAMAAQQNVVAALAGGPMVLTAAIGTVLLCLCATALLGRWGREPGLPSALEDHAEQVLSGDPE